MKAFTWSLSSVLLVLAGCGGGGGSGSGSASPTYAKIADLTTATTFSTAAAALTSSRPNTPAPTIAAVATTMAFSYDPATKTYQLSATPAGSTGTVSQTFGPSALQSTGGYSIISTKTDGTTLSDDLIFVLSGSPTQSSTSTANYIYTGAGQWRNGSSNSNTGIQNFNTYEFAYGIATQAGDLPRSGTAVYALQLTAEPESGSVVGSGMLTADFSAGTVTLTITPQFNQQSPADASLTPIATLTGSGTINFTANSFSATLTASNYTASVNGVFFGPQGAEVGDGFTLNPIGSFNGAIVAAGVMLGAKQ